MSYLLLSSDIKVDIEDPESYFDEDQKISNEKIDVLLLTQGWRRFSTANIAKGKFYALKYNVDRILTSTKSDLRTTIYWNPKLVADSTGNVHVQFYNADKASNYTVVFEGVTDKGEICRFKGSVRREDY